MKVTISKKYKSKPEPRKHRVSIMLNESEMRASVAYKNVYETINAISADVDITLGLKDETAPEIMLWDEE